MSTSTEKQAPSKGAMRAAREITRDWLCKSPSEIAEIIDRETQATALVEALRDCQSYIRTMLPAWNKAEDLPPCMHKATVALKAAGAL